MKRILTSIVLLAALLTASTGTVFAQEATPITGTVQLVEFGTDPDTGETFVIVTLADETGATQVVNISLATAEALGLVDSSSGTPLVNEGSYGTDVTIQPTDVLPGTDEGGEEEEAQHPVGGALSEFFSELLGVDYDTVMTAHGDGFGFGVIAQALWLTNQIGGDADTFTALLEAKKSGDYSLIVLADGSTPDNWGDVVKGLKKGENLGSVKSGKAEAETAPELESQQTTDRPGNGVGNGNGNGNGNANGSNADNSQVQNQGNNGNQGNGNGNGRGNNGNGNGKGGDHGGGKGKGKP